MKDVITAEAAVLNSALDKDFERLGERLRDFTGSELNDLCSACSEVLWAIEEEQRQRYVAALSAKNRENEKL